MNRMKSQIRRKPTAGVVLAVLILATGAWTALSSTRSSPRSPAAAKLEAPIPPAEGVFLQQRDGSDGLGNAFLRIQLSRARVKAKQQDGTADFLTIGTGESTVILRDDGAGGDEKAGDGLYTGFVDVDPEELAARATLDAEELANNPGRDITVFEGRSATGIVRPAAFDFNGFAGGAQVVLGPRVSFPLDQGPAPPPITFEDPVTPGTTSFQEKVLMITSTDVVTDSTRIWNPCTNLGNANGVWTFNHLITEIANNSQTGYDPAELVEDWLGTWLSPQTIKNDNVPARPLMQEILDQWPRRLDGKLDLEKSPLRLLAIVPRVDLRNGTGGSYSGGGGFKNGGELRFIFSFVARQTSTFDPAVFTGEAQINSSSCYALPFNVIFEYRVPKTTCEDVRSWAKRWVDLNGLPGPGDYNDGLAILTEEVVRAGITDDANGSALSQLRTNEVALGNPWELREFRLQKPTSYLMPSPVTGTPRGELNNRAADPNDPTSTLLRDWILFKTKPALEAANDNEVLDIPAVTDKFQGQDFIAGSAHTFASAANVIDFFWRTDHMDTSLPRVDVLNLALRDNWARHRFSRNTCNGCHSDDTFTQFVHVNSAKTMTSPPTTTSEAALPAELSFFLTGINGLGDPANAEANSATPSNPANGLPKRNFDDLARRDQDINNVATMSCSGMRVANRARVLDSLERTGRLPADLFEGAAPERLSVAIDDIRRNVISEVH